MFRLCSLSNQKFARSSVWSVLKIVVRKFVIVKVQFNGPRTSYSSIFRQEEIFGNFLCLFFGSTPGPQDANRSWHSWVGLVVGIPEPKKCDKSSDCAEEPASWRGGGVNPTWYLGSTFLSPTEAWQNFHLLKGKPTHGLINWQKGHLSHLSIEDSGSQTHWNVWFMEFCTQNHPQYKMNRQIHLCFYLPLTFLFPKIKKENIHPKNLQKSIQHHFKIHPKIHPKPRNIHPKSPKNPSKKS